MGSKGNWMEDETDKTCMLKLLTYVFFFKNQKKFLYSNIKLYRLSNSFLIKKILPITVELLCFSTKTGYSKLNAG